MLDRIIRAREITAIVGLSRPYLYVLINKGEFPEPVKLSSRASGWRESDIAAWIESRESSGLAPRSETTV